MDRATLASSTMGRWIAAASLAASAFLSQPALAAFVTYQVSSPMSLAALNVGDVVHIDVTLPGLTNYHDVLFNMVAQSSDNSLWGSPFNITTNSAMTPILVSPFAGGVNMVDIQDPVTFADDSVISFDITAIAAGSGFFRAGGADIYNTAPGASSDYNGGSNDLDFVINESSVPEPSSLLLAALALLQLKRLRRPARAL